MVQSLYKQVVARHPLGISADRNFLASFAPYLSERLIRKIKLDRLCEQDWYRRTHGADERGNVVKPPFAWLELGLFSGAFEQSEPVQFHITRSAPKVDGSTSVYLSLAEWGFDAQGNTAAPNNGPPEERWDIAVRVVEESGRPLVDDVVYLKGKYVDFESSLSGHLKIGCRGSHWVGRLY
jgi:hypothetical protein